MAIVGRSEADEKGHIYPFFHRGVSPLFRLYDTINMDLGVGKSYVMIMLTTFPTRLESLTLPAKDREYFKEVTIGIEDICICKCNGLAVTSNLF